MPRDRIEYIWELMIKLREEILSRQNVRVQIYGFKIAILTLLFAYIGSAEITRSNITMNKIGFIGNNEVTNLIILLPAITSVLLDLMVVSRNCCNFVSALYPTTITPRPSLNTFYP